jgi:hypothetical protein
MDDTATLDDVAAPEPDLDRSNESASGGGVPRVIGKWLPPPSRRRLLDHDVDLLDEDATDGDLILVSTRAPVGSAGVISELAAGGIPVVVVSHPGGEDLAVDFVGAGARTVVAEGAEHLALGLLDGTSHRHMVGLYREELEAAEGGQGRRGGIDPVTGLPTATAFERRLAELDADGIAPRIGLIELPLVSRLLTLGSATVSGIRRRFAVNLTELAHHHAAELFDVGNDLIAFVSASMTRDRLDGFARQVVALGSTFAPTGEPLDVAIGSAGSEVATDPAGLLASAKSALAGARGVESRHLDAEELTRTGAAALELEAAMHVADAVDRLDPRGDHQVRVGELAVALARRLELEPGVVATVGLAARLHDLGKVGFGAAAFDPNEDRHAEAFEAHGGRGADFVVLAAGEEVAAGIRSHHERWDGAGTPDGLAGTDIPFIARVVAAADLCDDLESQGLSGAELVAKLEEAAGTILDPDLVPVLTELRTGER